MFLIDNALRDGHVADPKEVRRNHDTRAIDEMNRSLRDDDRLDWCLLPVGDGVAMGRKR